MYTGHRIVLALMGMASFLIGEPGTIGFYGCIFLWGRDMRNS
jgi:hypothetical protein